MTNSTIEYRLRYGDSAESRRMPPPGWRKPPKTSKDAKAQGHSMIDSFFRPPSPKAAPAQAARGRPPKQIYNHFGRPAGSGTVAPAAVPPEPVAVGGTDFLPPVTKEKTPRTNWSVGDAKQRLDGAIIQWQSKTGNHLLQDPKMSLRKFAKCVHIPLATLHAYVHPAVSKRVVVGAHAGRPSLINNDTQAFLIDVIRRQDRGNEGFSNKEAVAMVTDLRPDLSLQQATNSFRRTIRRNHKEVLTSIVKAQASTTKCNQITIPQQYRWHKVSR